MTTSGPRVAATTAMDRAIGNCIISVGFGAGFGAILGAAVGGERGAAQGAIAGGLIGAGRCAVLIQVAAAEDRERIREAELAAIEANRTTTETITTESGKSAVIKTVVSPAPIPTAAAPSRPSTTAPAPSEQPQTSSDVAEQTVEPTEQPQTSVETNQQETSSENEEVETAAAQTSSEPQYTTCRESAQTITVDGQTADGGTQLWCRIETGDWQPINI